MIRNPEKTYPRDFQRSILQDILPSNTPPGKMSAEYMLILELNDIANSRESSIKDSADRVLSTNVPS
jgi:hypothetical protein